MFAKDEEELLVGLLRNDGDIFTFINIGNSNYKSTQDCIVGSDRAVSFLLRTMQCSFAFITKSNFILTESTTVKK